MGDSPDVREMLESITATRWRAVLAGKKLVVADEAQRIPGIGLSLQLLVDECSDVQVIATGSSAFEVFVEQHWNGLLAHPFNNEIKLPQISAEPAGQTTRNMFVWNYENHERIER